MGSAGRKTIDDDSKQLRAHNTASIAENVFLSELKTLVGETRHSRGLRPANCYLLLIFSFATPLNTQRSIFRFFLETNRGRAHYARFIEFSTGPARTGSCGETVCRFHPNRYSSVLDKNDYLHMYTDEGMTACDFEHAREQIHSLLDEYRSLETHLDEHSADFDNVESQLNRSVTCSETETNVVQL